MAHSGHRVVIVVEGIPNAQTMRIEERLRAELIAAGFEVVTVSRGEGADPSVVRGVFSETSSQGAVVIRSSGEDPAGVVWARDALTGAELVRDVKEETATTEGVSIFAIRAAEQVRASIIELEAGKGTIPPPEVPAPVAPTPPLAEVRAAPPAVAKPTPRLRPTESAAKRYELTGGGAVLVAPGGVPTAWGPTLAAGWRASPRWLGELRLIGPTLSSVDAPSGHVDLDQELVVMRVRAVFVEETGAVVVPAGVVGLGAHRIGVRGTANAPYGSASNHAWTGVLTLGMGARARVTSAVELHAEAGVWWTSSRPMVRVAGGDDMHTGQPGFSGLVGLALRW